jgi:hypothetical protein
MISRHATISLASNTSNMLSVVRRQLAQAGHSDRRTQRTPALASRQQSLLPDTAPRVHRAGIKSRAIQAIGKVVSPKDNTFSLLSPDNTGAETGASRFVGLDPVGLSKRRSSRRAHPFLEMMLKLVGTPSVRALARPEGFAHPTDIRCTFQTARKSHSIVIASQRVARTRAR